MSIEQLVKDKLFTELNKAKSTIESCEACLANDDYEQAYVRLQELGARFTQFECDVFDRIKDEGIS